MVWLRGRRLHYVVWVILMALSMPAGAAERDMTGAEIREALSGNTVDGVWGAARTPYRSYFDAAGWTQYKEKGRDVTRGTWRATDDGEYCSRWGTFGGESCYGLRRDGDRIIWVLPGSGTTYPSTLLPGKQIDW